MKNKNIVFIAQSLDGYIAGKNGELDWLDMIPNPDGDDMGYNSLMGEIDALVMGRVSFETVLDFGIDWPYKKPVFVISKTLKTIPDDLQDHVFLLAGTPQEIIAHTQEKGYQNLYIDGGQTIQSFLKEDLIDELRITTIPILLGGGFSLFGDLIKPLEFELIQSKIHLNQLVQTHYKRKR